MNCCEWTTEGLSESVAANGDMHSDEKQTTMLSFQSTQSHAHAMAEHLCPPDRTYLRKIATKIKCNVIVMNDLLAVRE